MPAPAVSAAGTPEFPLTTVSTEDLALTFAATRGGRLLSLRVGGAELLWHNPALLDQSLSPLLPISSWPDGSGGMSTWANIGGSKTWPAPQGWGGAGEWAGPPDGVLDSGVWTEDVVLSEDSATITLTSPDDPRSGIRVTRCFHIPAVGTRFEQSTTFLNVSAVPVRWSIWEVCQVDVSGGVGRSAAEAAVVIPITATSRILDLGTWLGAVQTGKDDSAIRIPVGTAVAKRGFADVPGSVAYEGPDGERLSLSQDAVPGALYPDGGASVEVWLQFPTAEPIAELENLRPDAHVAELEVLGPLVSLAPGESTGISITWTAASPR